MIQTALALLIPAALGFLFISVLLKEDSGSGFLERLCLGYPAGMGLLTLQIFLLGLLRIPLTAGFSAAPVIAAIAVLSFFIWKEKIPLLSGPSSGYLSEIVSDTSDIKKKMAMLLLLVWAIVKLGSIFAATCLRPLWAWDSWANWSAGAKVFFYSKSLLLDAPMDEFFGRGAAARILSYPLHNTLSQVWLSLWLNRFDDVLVKIWSPVYLLCTAGYLYFFTRSLINTLTALAIVVLFLSSPLMSYHATEVYSDLLLAAYLFFATTSFFYVMKGRDSYLALVGIFSAQAMFCKDEAIFFVLPLLLSVIFFVWKNKKRKFAGSLLRLLVPLVYIVPWYIFKFSHSLSLGAEFIEFEFRFYPETIIEIIKSFMQLDNFNIMFVFFPFLILINGRPAREFLYLLFPVICYGLFFITLYIFTTYYNEHFNNGTVFYRNILTYYPTVCMLTVLLLKGPLTKVTACTADKPV